MLRRLEIKEPVSLNDLIYLHQQANEYAEVDRWVKKLLSSDKFVGPELNATSSPIAA